MQPNLPRLPPKILSAEASASRVHTPHLHFQKILRRRSLLYKLMRRNAERRQWISFPCREPVGARRNYHARKPILSTKEGKLLIRNEKDEGQGEVWAVGSPLGTCFKVRACENRPTRGRLMAVIGVSERPSAPFSFPPSS